MAGPNETAIRINGKVYDWGSYTIKFDDERYDGIKSISYAQKRERTLVYASTFPRLPLGKTGGKVTTEEIKVKMLAQTWADMRLNLALRAGGISYGDRIFDISVIATGIGLPSLNDVLGMVSIASENGGGEENVEGLEVEIGMQFGIMMRDGLTLWENLF